MNDIIGIEEKIHLSELDEYLASKLLSDSTTPLRFSVARDDFQGNIRIQQRTNDTQIGEGGIDFELSPSEYQSLDSMNISDITKQTIYTSSAYEFFDFILMYLSDLDLILDFKGSSWRIRILSYQEDSKSS